MSLVRVHNFSVDGFGAGEGRQLHAPFGYAGSRLVEWAFATRTFREIVHRKLEASFGVDDAFASEWGPGIGVVEEPAEVPSAEGSFLAPDA